LRWEVCKLTFNHLDTQSPIEEWGCTTNWHVIESQMRQSRIKFSSVTKMANQNNQNSTNMHQKSFSFMKQFSVAILSIPFQQKTQKEI
jgi:hypothetical protein